MENRLIFIGGIDSPLWIDDGNRLSRNYKQGYRVYDSNGIAQTILSQCMGGFAGYSGLYLVREKWKK